MKVYLSELAESKLLKLTEYLLENWGQQVRDKFIEKLNERVEQIRKQPNSCPKSKEITGLYRCVITKQISLYYRVLNHVQEIEIITVFDTRQNPDKLKSETE